MATGACSRDEPQPKLAPPIMIGYSVFVSPGSTNLRSAGLTRKGQNIVGPERSRKMSTSQRAAANVTEGECSR